MLLRHVGDNVPGDGDSTDSRRPPAMALTTDQAATLLAKCDHIVATCPTCRIAYKPRDLSPMFFTSGKRYGCGTCSRELTVQVEYHIETCRNFAPTSGR